MPRIPVKARDVCVIAEELREACDELPEHEACGVDSFSIQQRAMEYLDDEGFTSECLEDIVDMDNMEAATARLLVFVFEFQFSVKKLEAGIKVEEVVRDIRERFDMTSVSDEELFKNHLVDYEE